MFQSDESWNMSEDLGGNRGYMPDDFLGPVVKPEA